MSTLGLLFSCFALLADPSAEPSTRTAPPPRPVLEVDQSHSRAVATDEAMLLPERPRYRGTGLFAAAGSLYASVLLFQIIDVGVCGDCAFGYTERAGLATAAALAPAGAALRANSDAWHDAKLRRSKRNTSAVFASGVVLALIGVVGGVTNEIFWWQRIYWNTGPYAVHGDAIPPGVVVGPRLALDASAAMTTVGLSMLTWSASYDRPRRSFSRVDARMRPVLSPSHAGVAVSGRF